MAHTMKNDLVEAVVEVAGVAKAQAMNDPGSPKDVAEGKRNPRKRYGIVRSWSFYR